MEKNNLEKMNQGARVVAKVLQVVFWLFIVVGGFLIIGGIVVHFMPDHYFVISDFYKGDLVFEIEGLFKYEFTNELGREVMLKPIILLVIPGLLPVSYTHLRAHETRHDLVCRLLLEKKKKTNES